MEVKEALRFRRTVRPEASVTTVEEEAAEVAAE